MMRVLVTGATSPLGAAITESLVGATDVGLVLAIGRPADPAPAEHLKLAYRDVDLTRPRALHDLLWGDARDLGITAVVHAAHHRGAETGRRVHAQNVAITRELVRGCTDHPTIDRFVYRSFAEVYATQSPTSNVIDEDEPLNFDRWAPQWVRDRVEADLTVSTHLGGALSIAVLRCAEILAPGTGSQLWDYLRSRVCFRPLGFDPVINLLSLTDAVRAVGCALRCSAIGIFNIPGYDTLPLSIALEASRRFDIPVPGPVMAPLYALRRRVLRTSFDYAQNAQRFHVGGVLDGARARDVLGYVPQQPLVWPQAWWQQLLGRLGAERLRAD